MTLSRNVDGTLRISMQTIMIINFFVLNSETLMFHYCFLDDSLMMLWKDIVETLKIANETFVIFFVFVVLTSESLICHCWSIGESLMILWRNIDDTTEFGMRTMKIIEVSNVLIIRTLMFFAAWLIFRWWSYEESSIRFGDLDANINDNTFLC